MRFWRTKFFSFLTSVNTILHFVKSLVLVCIIRQPASFFTKSSTSSKIVHLVPRGKLCIFTWLSLDSFFWFMQFSKEPPAITAWVFKVDCLFPFIVSLIVKWIELSMVHGNTLIDTNNNRTFSISNDFLSTDTWISFNVSNSVAKSKDLVLS